MKLTIAVLTMNRCDQVIDALNSCLSCSLPENTEIIILDNASTDQTLEKLESYKKINVNQTIYIHHSDTNLGVGGGRNHLFSLASGEYVYFMDDDAIIAEDSRKSFFVDTVHFMDEHEKVASVTTSIYDELLGTSRTTAYHGKKIYGMDSSFIFLGGSHFLRKSAFSSPLYLNLKYGAEEFYPSICAIDKGYYHVVNNSIRIIHKPRINKWTDGSDELKEILIKNSANVYATKKILYPAILSPILFMGYYARKVVYLAKYSGASKKADILAKEIIMENPLRKKIAISTVFRMIRDYGLSVL